MCNQNAFFQTQFPIRRQLTELSAEKSMKILKIQHETLEEFVYYELQK